ncbi:MAG TPA: ABC transporter ATP-binding protein [Bacillales bacterium]|nr:ABC transporter ATP-binding protein [Bacillales bacterium]
MENLTKQYDETTAVDHLNLEIERGEIFGLLGPNGAGKSTTILMMLGLTEPTSGNVSVCGIDSTRKPIEVKKRVGYLPDDVGFYEDLSGLDNLLYTAQLNRIPKKEALERAESLLKRVGLAESGEKKAGKYSRGMRQRLGLADVLIKNPEVIILDEPTLGIDPEGVREFLDLIQRLSRDEGITVLLSSHHLHQVQQVCDRVGLFVHGRLLAKGDVHTLANQLFADRPIVISVKAPNLSDECIERLNQMDDVIKITQEGEALSIEAGQDITAEVAKTVIETEGTLEYVNKRDYGLDEIYHQYFEGGEARGDTRLHSES